MRVLAVRTAVAAALLVGVAACGSSSPAPPPATSPAATTTSAAPSTNPSAEATSSASSGLRGAVLKQTDFTRTGLTLDADGVRPAPQAAELSRHSFDYCGGTFGTEGSRVERYSVVAGFTKPQAGAIYNEIVRYGSPTEAGTALEEFRKAVQTCDKGSHPSVINDGKAVTFRPQQGPSTVTQLANNNTVVQSELVSEGSTISLTQFIAQYGDAVVITYAATQGATQTKVNEAVGALGTLVGQRL